MVDKEKDIVEVARELATTYHKGATDKYGNPYIDHLERVVDRVRDMEYDMVDETSHISMYLAAAYLHDIIEDTSFDFDIDDRGYMDIFPAPVVEAVKLLTRGDGETYADYVTKIKLAPDVGGKIARVVKLADLFDHLMGPTPCPPNLIKRYEKSLYSLYGRK
tara:strand:- start:114 stop:599 length:486 start_codon:yes stop_codon:yes gene_type:complete